MPSPLCLPFSRSPDNALMLTSADTEQVASSQWLSEQPSNRKHVSPDIPAPVPNVAAGRTRGFVLTVSGDISSGRGRPSPSFGLGVSVSGVERVSPLQARSGGSCQVHTRGIAAVQTGALKWKRGGDSLLGNASRLSYSWWLLNRGVKVLQTNTRLYKKYIGSLDTFYILHF